MIDPTELRGLVAAYLGGAATLEALDNAVAVLGEDPTALDPDVASVWGNLELRLSEFTGGHIDENEFRGALFEIAPADVEIGRSHRSYVVVTASMSSTQPATGLGAQVPFPAVDTRLVGGRA